MLSISGFYGEETNSGRASEFIDLLNTVPIVQRNAWVPRSDPIRLVRYSALNLESVLSPPNGDPGLIITAQVHS